MSNHIYEFLALKQNFKSKEKVFDFCKESNLQPYWFSKKLFVIKDDTLKTESRKELSKRLKKFIESFNGINWENKNIEKLDTDHLKRNIVEPSIPYTVAIYTKIKLKQPYFSRDDQEYFYFIDNPVLKDKATKTPMARGSGVKGKLEVCAAQVIFEAIKNLNENNLISELIKYFRIFGSGNDEIKKLNESLKKLFNEEKLDNLTDESKEKIANQFIIFILQNFGGNVAKQAVDNILSSKNTENVINEIIDWIYQNFKDKKILKIQKGRLTFYPIYFNEINIEVINRHLRSTRAGKGPIYFEVVASEQEANLILVYTPFDAVFSKNKDEIRKETEEDLDFIIKSLEKLQIEGIGAKRKYGWGQFEITEKTLIKRNQDELKEYQGWTIK